MRKIFVHIGAPKAGSSSLQHFFHDCKDINFLGLIRDHEDKSFNKIYRDNKAFFQYCRYKKSQITEAKKIKNKISRNKINLASEEDFFTSYFGNYKKKIERIIKIFPKCEFIVVLRDPSEILLSWHNFDIRRNPNTETNLKDYINNEKKKLIVELIDYKKRINYFKSLKNKFHIINFNLIIENKIIYVFEEIFQKKNFGKKNKILIKHKNNSVYFLKEIFQKSLLLKKIKTYIPKFFLSKIKLFLFNFNYFKSYKSKSNYNELRYLDKLFHKEKKYYKLIFKKKNYIKLN